MAISISISEFKRCTRTHMRSPETTWTSHQNLRTRSVVQEANRSFPDMNFFSYRRLQANFWFSVQLTRTEIKLLYCASLLDFPIVVGPSGASVVGRSSILQLLFLHCKFMAKSFWATVHHVTMSARAGFKACCSSWRPGWYPHTCHTKWGRFQSLRGGHECTMIFLLCVSNDYFVRFTCWCGKSFLKIQSPNRKSTCIRRVSVSDAVTHPQTNTRPDAGLWIHVGSWQEDWIWIWQHVFKRSSTWGQLSL